MICCRCDHYYDELASRWLCPRCGEHNPCCDGAPLPEGNDCG